MKLLDYETLDGQEGSHNDLIKKLVRQVRYYYSEVSNEEFKMAIPELKSMEGKIQMLDSDMGNEHREYLSEIMDELGVETETENLLVEEFKRTASVLIPKLDGPEFNVEDFSFDFSNQRGINVVEFYGYRETKKLDTTAIMVKDILQSVSYKYKAIFIDSSRITE